MHRITVVNTDSSNGSNFSSLSPVTVWEVSHAGDTCGTIFEEADPPSATNRRDNDNNPKISSWRKRRLRHTPTQDQSSDDHSSSASSSIVAARYFPQRRDLPLQLTVDDPIDVESVSSCEARSINHSKQSVNISKRGNRIRMSTPRHQSRRSDSMTTPRLHFPKDDDKSPSIASFASFDSFSQNSRTTRTSKSSEQQLGSSHHYYAGGSGRPSSSGHSKFQDQALSISTSTTTTSDIGSFGSYYTGSSHREMASSSKQHSTTTTTKSRWRTGTSISSRSTTNSTKNSNIGGTIGGVVRMEIDGIMVTASEEAASQLQVGSCEWL